MLTLYTTPVIYLFFDRLAADSRERPRSVPEARLPCAARSDEHFRALHPPARRDHAAGRRRRARRASRIQAASRCAAAASRFPDDLGAGALPGASPEIMASSVATPLERQLGHIAGVTEITSASPSARPITLAIRPESNIDGAARDVQAAINAARANLPANLPSNPSYRKVNPADAPIMILAPHSRIFDRRLSFTMSPRQSSSRRLSRSRASGQVNVGGSSPAGRARRSQSRAT